MFMWNYAQVSTTKVTFHKRRSFHHHIGLKVRKKPGKFYLWNTVIFGVEIWTFREVDQKYLERFEMWCWRTIKKKVGKIVWWHKVMKERTILHTTNRRKDTRECTTYKGQEYEEEDIRGYLMKRMNCIALCAELALQDATDLSQDSLRNYTDWPIQLHET